MVSLNISAFNTLEEYEVPTYIRTIVEDYLRGRWIDLEPDRTEMERRELILGFHRGPY